MKKIILFLLFTIVALGTVNAQRKVLMEAFTGARDSACPMGSYRVDSLAAVYPNIIPVSLHTYAPSDAMDFATIDTLALTYVPAYPAAAIDRISHAGVVGVLDTEWNADIQQRLAMDTKLNVDVAATWDSVTRDIATHVQVSITDNIDTGDYRIGLYVVEDSVTGTGAGYNQANAFNTVAGNPFFGHGNPITGFVHRHVARALLPSAWGLAGVLSSAPTVGQNYAHIFHYTLPAGYNENRITLVAFVYASSVGNLDDSILNAAGHKLEIHPATKLATYGKGNFSIYPNPASDMMTFSSGDSKTYTLYLSNALGQVILRKDFSGSASVARSELGNAGLYFARIMQGGELLATKAVTFLD